MTTFRGTYILTILWSLVGLLAAYGLPRARVRFLEMYEGHPLPFPGRILLDVSPSTLLLACLVVAAALLAKDVVFLCPEERAPLLTHVNRFALLALCGAVVLAFLALLQCASGPGFFSEL